jgi:DNA-binding response OmpR family regulator
MPLSTATVLVLHSNAETAHALVNAVQKANADVIVSANALEALQRVRQFAWHAAVVDGGAGTDALADELRHRAVPFCVLGERGLQADFVAADVEAVVPWLCEVLGR